MSSPAPPRRVFAFLLLVLVAVIVGLALKPRSGPPVEATHAAALASGSQPVSGPARAVPSTPAAVGNGPATRPKDDALRPWSTVHDLRGAKLEPKTAAYFAAVARGEKPAGRTAVAEVATAAPLSSLQKGAQLILQLPGGDEVIGRVNLVLHENAGVTRLGGELMADRQGSFSLSAQGTELSGRILLPGEDLACEISPQGGGRVALHERLLSEIICHPLPPEREGPQTIIPSGPQAAPPLLSSRPTATAVLYLDFDGETVVDPDWNNGIPIDAAASPLTNSQITEVWNYVKEDFTPFNIDVTTDPSRYTNAPLGRRARCIITPSSSWFGAVGGVAYLRTFRQAGTLGFSTTIPSWVFNSTVKGIAEAVSHELGHMLGLLHDGRKNPNESYYLGQGTGAVGWAPIMGAAYYQPVTQWSKGEYFRADNQEDDVAIIAGAANGFGYIADDAGDTRATAASLGASTGTFTKTGVISSENDVDYHVFTIGFKGLFATIVPASVAPNLDVLVELQDSNGSMLLFSNPDRELGASMTFVMPAGTYYLKVQGTARGSPTVDGYSRYGSVGAYTIAGEFFESPTIVTHPTSRTANTGSTVSFNVEVTPIPTLAYQWLKNGIPVPGGPNVTGATGATLTLTDVQWGDAGNYSVRVSTAAGSTTSSVAMLSVIGRPGLVAPPLSRFATPGQAVTFSVSAISHEAVSYQWMRNGQAIAGATTPTFTIASAGLPDRGWYDIVLTNTLGTTRSRFRFDVSPPNSTVVAWGTDLDGQANVPVGVGNIVAAEAGNEHSLALRADGTVMAWGRNGSGQATVPAGLKDVVAISAGGSHSLALKADGTVVSWGNNTSNQTVGLRDVIAISAGYGHSLALKADGTLAAWGNANSQVLTIPPGLADVVEVTAGFAHNVAIKADGTVAAWGGNFSGELNAPAGLNNVVGISTSGSHTLAVKSDGSVVAWGANGAGQCDVPAGLASVTRVSAGATHSMALKADGTIIRWGTDSFGLSPLPAGLTNVSAISARGVHYLALVPVVGVSIAGQPEGDTVSPGAAVSFSVLAAGTPSFGYQWKRNNVVLTNGGRIAGANSATLLITNADLGDSGSYTVLVTNPGGDVTSQAANLIVATPPAIAARPLSKLVTVGQPVSFTAAASGSGPLTYQWRRNGQIVPGATAATLSIAAASLTDGGWYHVGITGSNGGRAVSVFHLAVTGRTFGSAGVTAWGLNFSGQTNVPATLSGVVAVSGGGNHSLALRADGTVAAWGWTAYGLNTVPAGLNGVAAISAGYYHSLALKADGTVVAWGNGSGGLTTIPATLRDVVAIAAGVDHSVALMGDGHVVAWGNSSSNYAAPAGLGNVVAIAAGSAHGLALKADGTIVGWGENTWGQATPPLGLTGVVGIAAGSVHSLALKNDGTVVGWGTGPGSPQLVPTGLTGVISIFAGLNFSLALKSDGSLVAWGDNSAGQIAGTTGIAPVLAAAAGGYHGLAIIPLVAPTFAVQPQPATVAAGQTVTFSVTVTSSSSVAYQWLKDGMSLAGATNPTLSLPDVQQGDGGNYSVVATNGGGSMTSVAVLLTVTGPPIPPVWRAQTPSQGIVAGGSVTFSATASGSTPLSYQWYNGSSGDLSAPVAGATTPSLMVTSPLDSRTYWLRVSNSQGTRDTATMRVLPWTLREVGLGAVNLGGASYANGRYFVFANEGGVMSSNGFSWTPIGGSFAGKAGAAVAFGSGVYVAGGGSTGQAIYSSTDGIAWTTRDSAQNSIISRVIFNGTRFIATGEGGQVSTSENGLNWTLRYSSSSVLYDLAMGDGVLVAVGLGGHIVRSTDGIMWAAISPPTLVSFTSVVFGQGRFVAFGSGPSGREAWTSVGGSTWTQIGYPVYPLSQLSEIFPVGPATYGGGVFVAVAGTHLLISEDGLTWAVTPDFFWTQTNRPSSLAYGNGRFLFAGEMGQVLLSLPVFGLPNIITTPAGGVVASGQSTSLSVVAGGSNLAYQWYLGVSGDTTQPILGATAATFSTGPLTQSQSFWVRASNAQGSADSVSIAVQVATIPAIAVTLAEREVQAGITFELEAQVNGFPAPSLQWYAGNVGDTSNPLPGETGPVLNRIVGTAVERYWLRATNLAGAGNSPPCRITPWTLANGAVVAESIREIDGMLVAIGGTGFFTSTDTRIWTTTGVPITNSYIRDIAQGAGLYVAVGDRGFFSSTDLRYWTPRNVYAGSDSYNGAFSIARGNGVFVAVGINQYFSSNGIDWSVCPVPFGVQLRSVVFDGVRFVACGYLNVLTDPTLNRVGVVFSSTDGVTWTRVAQSALPEGFTNANTPLTRIGFAGGRYFALRDEGGFLLVSPDATNWTRVALPPVPGGAQIRSVGFIAGRFMLGTDNEYYLMSADGLTWSMTKGPDGMAAYSMITYSGELLASSSSGTIFATRDGLMWNQRAGAPLFNYSTAYGGGRFVAIGFNGTFVSEDGMAWRRTALDVSNQGNARIAHGDGQFVVLSESPGFVYRSVDGERWEHARVSNSTTPYSGIASVGGRVLPLSGELRDATFGAGTYVAVGRGIATSNDGIAWTPLGSVPLHHFTAVAFGNGIFVAVGADGSQPVIFTSTNGTAWMPRTFPNPVNAPLHDVVFAGDRFIVAGSGILFSVDGITWIKSDPLASQILNLTMSNGIVFGTGSASMVWRRAHGGASTSITSLSPAREIVSGGMTTLSVAAVGTGLSYQWYRGASGNTTVPVAAATGPNFNPPPATANQRYWVRVNGAADTVDSPAILVAIAGPPVVTAQPFPVDVSSIAGPFDLRVEAESVAPLSYQWFEGRSGDALRPVIGATGAVLVLPPPPVATRYWVRIINQYGSTDSADALVTPWVVGSLATEAAPIATTGLAYGGGRFVVTALAPEMPPSTYGRVLVSTDGQNWSPHAAPSLGPVAFGHGRFVAPALTPNNRLYHSTDGIDWTPIDLPATGVQLTHLFFVGERFVALSVSGTIAMSADGMIWSLSAAGTQPLHSVAFGQGRFIVTGPPGTVFTSTDGVAWQPVSVPSTVAIRSVAFGGGKFLAVTAEGVVLASADGIAWARADVLTSDRWLTLAFGQTLSFVEGRFVGGATGPDNSVYNSMDTTRWWPGLTGLARVVPANGALFGINVTTSVTVAGSSVSVGATGGGKFYRALPEPERPVITTPPAAQSLLIGQPLTLSVTASGPGLLGYQWRKNGVNLAGQTAATLTLTQVQTGDAGNYVVVVSNAHGSVGSAPVNVTVMAPTAPIITSQPASVALNAGGTATFNVLAAGTAPLSYLWRKDGTPLPDATTGILTRSSVQPADAGNYTVEVSNAAGSVTSLVAHLSVTPGGITAVHALEPGGYVGGGTVTVANTINYTGETPGLTWQVPLPDGWSLASSAGDAGGVKPAPGATNLLEWQWSTLPPGPINFTYTLNIPSTASGVYAIAALVTRHLGGGSLPFLALPDPLPIRPRRHTADTDENDHIDLVELTRVIEIYNTRHGTTRTGSYAVAVSTTEDGFFPAPARANGATVALAAYHTADSNHDGKLGLLELTRVIELYNTRSGTARTGHYRVQIGTEDGFAPGP